MKFFLNLAFVAVLAFGLAGCSKDDILETGGDEGSPAAVSFIFNKPKGAYTQTRADIATANEWKIAALDVYAVVDGAIAKLTRDTHFTQIDGTESYTVTMKPDWIASALGKTVNFYFVGNDASSAEGAHSELLSPAGESDLRNALTDFLTLDGDNKAALIEANGTNKNLLFSAVAENVKIMGKVQQTATLKRREARFDIVNPINSRFIIDNIYVAGANRGGFIFANADLADPAIPKATLKNIAGPVGYDADGLAAGVFYLYPTVLGAGKTNIVIEAHTQGNATRLLYEVVSEQAVRANARYKIVLNPATLTFSLVVADYDEGDELDVEDITGPGLLNLSTADGTGVVTNTSYQLIAGENATVTALLGAQSSAGFDVSVSAPGFDPAIVTSTDMTVHPVKSTRAVSQVYFPVTVDIHTNYPTATPGTEVFVTFTDKANPKSRATILLYDKTTVRVPEPAANSYIVKPNGPIIEIPISRAYEHWGSGLAGGDNFHIKFLWTDNPNGMDAAGAVADTYVKDDGDDAVVFVKPGAVSGNAVVAVTLDGVIQWSWHIWVTDYDPNTAIVNTADGKYNATGGHVYRYTSIGAGTVNYPAHIGPNVLMDRNIGALSATPGDAATHGMYYQWGRKDPFMYKGDWVDEPTLPKYYDQRGVQYQIGLIDNAQTPNGGNPDNMAFAIANPHTFIHRRVANAAQGISATAANWYSSVSYPDNLWGYNGTTTYSKSIYDPCPSGWKVPIAGVFHGLVATPGNAYEIRYFENGREGTGSKATVGYFPAQGSLGKTTGLYSGLVANGYVWFSNTYRNASGAESGSSQFNRFTAGSYNACNNTERDNAVPVRCVRE